jgi:hypothetical protein
MRRVQLQFLQTMATPYRTLVIRPIITTAATTNFGTANCRDCLLFLELIIGQVSQRFVKIPSGVAFINYKIEFLLLAHPLSISNKNLLDLDRQINDC